MDTNMNYIVVDSFEKESDAHDLVSELFTRKFSNTKMAYNNSTCKFEVRIMQGTMNHDLDCVMDNLILEGFHPSLSTEI